MVQLMEYFTAAPMTSGEEVERIVRLNFLSIPSHPSSLSCFEGEITIFYIIHFYRA